MTQIKLKKETKITESFSEKTKKEVRYWVYNKDEGTGEWYSEDFIKALKEELNKLEI